MTSKGATAPEAWRPAQPSLPPLQPCVVSRTWSLWTQAPGRGTVSSVALGSGEPISGCGPWRGRLQGAPPNEMGSRGAGQDPEEPGGTAAGAPRSCSLAGACSQRCSGLGCHTGLPPTWDRERAGPYEVTEPMAPAILLRDREREVVSTGGEHRR